MKAKFYIYRNLHTNTFSIKFRQKVIRHPNSCILKNVIMKVSRKGLLRVRKEKVKNVHAMLAAEKIKSAKNIKINEYEEFFYDPYKYDTFVKKDKTPIFKAKEVLCLNSELPRPKGY